MYMCKTSRPPSYLTAAQLATSPAGTPRCPAAWLSGLFVGAPKVIPGPTSGCPQAEESTEEHRTAKNSLAAGIRGWG